ncbi:hypothetical protein L484_014754 [Morus notabilis]|uniref:Uncharacterized protein n=1 Tax=Morus notabilis TaxID=981085 RepID=W9R098_9ROSA|nr:hypothetical protein L484_014754 [Morus notabilis]
MVLNSQVVLAVANASANVWQYISCNPEHFTTHQLLHLLFFFPLRFLRRLFSFLCFPSLSASRSD